MAEKSFYIRKEEVELLVEALEFFIATYSKDIKKDNKKWRIKLSIAAEFLADMRSEYNNY